MSVKGAGEETCLNFILSSSYIFECVQQVTANL